MEEKIDRFKDVKLWNFYHSATKRITAQQLRGNEQKNKNIKVVNVQQITNVNVYVSDGHHKASTSTFNGEQISGVGNKEQQELNNGETSKQAEKFVSKSIEEVSGKQEEQQAVGIVILT